MRVSHDGKQVIDLVVADADPVKLEALRSGIVVRVIPRFGRAQSLRTEALVALEYEAVCSEFRTASGSSRTCTTSSPCWRRARYLDVVHESAAKDFAKLRDDFESSRR